MGTARQPLGSCECEDAPRVRSGFRWRARSDNLRGYRRSACAIHVPFVPNSACNPPALAEIRMDVPTLDTGHDLRLGVAQRARRRLLTDVRFGFEFPWGHQD